MIRLTGDWMIRQKINRILDDEWRLLPGVDYTILSGWLTKSTLNGTVTFGSTNYYSDITIKDKKYETMLALRYPTGTV